MVVVNIGEDLNLTETKYNTIADFLGVIDKDLIYEEYLERKCLEVKNASSVDFINL